MKDGGLGQQINLMSADRDDASKILMSILTVPNI